MRRRDVAERAHLDERHKSYRAIGNEVLCFYTDLMGRPQEVRTWIDERQKAIGPHAGAQERAGILKHPLESSFPFAK